MAGIASPLAAAADPCKTTPTPADPVCHFRSKVGKVTLKVTGNQGDIKFERAEYNGTPVAGTPADTITFDVVAGQHPLDVVYTFSDLKAGRGVMSEVCVNNVLLDPNVNFTSTAVEYKICA